MFFLHQRLSWSLAVLFLLQHVSHCTEPPPLQSRWHSNGLSSNLLARAPYDGGDLMDFDDMPDCAKKGCLPIDPTKLGCSANITKECYCSTTGQWSCASGGGCVQTLFWQWLAHVCLAVPLDNFDTIPTCARRCIERGYIRESCSLRSWDCFCTTSLSLDCLKTCTAKDKDIMAAWKTEQCATYDSGPVPGTESTTSAKYSSATTQRATSRATVATGTATPDTTGLWSGPPESTTSPGIANGGAQRWLPSMTATTTFTVVVIVFQIATCLM